MRAAPEGLTPAVNDAVEGIVGRPVTLEELKHRPGRRRTMRARGPRGSAIVKLYGSERAPTVAGRVEALAAGPGEPIVPTVLHVDADLHLVVLSDVEGRPLREALLAGDLATCARVGAALGRWHDAWHGATPDPMLPHTMRREVAVLRARAEASSQPVARAVEEALSQPMGEWECPTVVHRDLYEEQVLVGERIGLIDLDDAATGPPELDMGNLIAHVELLELRQGRDLAAERAALLGAYARTGPVLVGALLERCRRLTLLRLACLNDDIRLVDAAVAQGVLA